MTLDLTHLRTSLEHTPGALNALLLPLPDRLLDANEGPGTWTPRQVAMHLVWGEVDD